MPALGLGTWRLKGEECHEAVLSALDLGYRHVDTAQIYGNEEEVGAALERSEVPRNEIFLTTKVWSDSLEAEKVKTSLTESLDKLRTDYVDLLLIHWPKRRVPLEETLSAMAEEQEAGRVTHLGVSNFTPELVRQAQEVCPSPIFCNQVEYHPFLSQQKLLETCRQEGVTLVAYSPLARGGVFDNDVLQRIGKRHDRTAGQVALRWLLEQEGVGAIPKSSSAEHQRENLGCLDFELSEKEMAKIHELARGERLIGVEDGPWNW
jgi:diketogulonate reductase-like aldo/keto reductase